MKFATYKHKGLDERGRVVWARRHVFEADDMDEAIEAAILYIGDGDAQALDPPPELDCLLDEVSILVYGTGANARMWQVVDEDWRDGPLPGDPYDASDEPTRCRTPGCHRNCG